MHRPLRKMVGNSVMVGKSFFSTFSPSSIGEIFSVKESSAFDDSKSFPETTKLGQSLQGCILGTYENVGERLLPKM